MSLDFLEDPDDYPEHWDELTTWACSQTEVAASEDDWACSQTEVADSQDDWRPHMSSDRHLALETGVNVNWDEYMPVEGAPSASSPKPPSDGPTDDDWGAWKSRASPPTPQSEIPATKLHPLHPNNIFSLSAAYPGIPPPPAPEVRCVLGSKAAGSRNLPLPKASLEAGALPMEVDLKDLSVPAPCEYGISGALADDMCTQVKQLPAFRAQESRSAAVMQMRPKSKMPSDISRQVPSHPPPKSKSSCEPWASEPHAVQRIDEFTSRPALFRPLPALRCPARRKTQARIAGHFGLYGRPGYAPSSKARGALRADGPIFKVLPPLRTAFATVASTAGRSMPSTGILSSASRRLKGSMARCAIENDSLKSSPITPCPCASPGALDSLVSVGNCATAHDRATTRASDLEEPSNQQMGMETFEHLDPQQRELMEEAQYQLQRAHFEEVQLVHQMQLQQMAVATSPAALPTQPSDTTTTAGSKLEVKSEVKAIKLERKQLCAHFAKGKCKYGEHCFKVHDEPEQESPALVATDLPKGMQGLLVSFNYEKRFGFIRCGEARLLYDQDVFVHITEMNDFEVGDVVSFDVILGKTGKPQARGIRKIEQGAEREAVLEAELANRSHARPRGSTSGPTGVNAPVSAAVGDAHGVSSVVWAGVPTGVPGLVLDASLPPALATQASMTHLMPGLPGSGPDASLSSALDFVSNVGLQLAALSAVTVPAPAGPCGTNAPQSLPCHAPQISPAAPIPGLLPALNPLSAAPGLELSMMSSATPSTSVSRPVVNAAVAHVNEKSPLGSASLPRSTEAGVSSAVSALVPASSFSAQPTVTNADIIRAMQIASSIVPPKSVVTGSTAEVSGLPLSESAQGAKTMSAQLAASRAVNQMIGSQLEHEPKVVAPPAAFRSPMVQLTSNPASRSAVQVQPKVVLPSEVRPDVKSEGNKQAIGLDVPSLVAQRDVSVAQQGFSPLLPAAPLQARNPSRSAQRKRRRSRSPRARRRRSRKRRRHRNRDSDSESGRRGGRAKTGNGDPPAALAPLCPVFLTGKCWDQACGMRHAPGTEAEAEEWLLRFGGRMPCRLGERCGAVDCRYHHPSFGGRSRA